jgi:CRP/FNR family cyclic AMP-dependent transcriptional regulator
MARDRVLDSTAVIRPTAFDLFVGIPQPERGRIARRCGKRRYAKGATVFSEGDPGDAMFIVEEGLVKLLSVSNTGAETILHILKPGEIFGELFFAEERRAFDAVAGTEVVVTVIPRKSFEEILASCPAGLAGFGHTWSYQRLAKVLLQLGAEHGIPAPAGTLIQLGLTHEDLAKLIGTTRETVTKQVNRLKKMGLLKREGRHLILNTKRLAEFVSGPEGQPDHEAGP